MRYSSSLNPFFTDNLNLQNGSVKFKPLRPARRCSCALAAKVSAFVLVVGLAIVCAFFVRINRVASAKAVTKSNFLTHYSVENGSMRVEEFRVLFTLRRDQSPNYDGDIIAPSEGNTESKLLDVEVSSETEHRLHFMFRDHDRPRWEIPFSTSDPSSPEDKYSRSSISSLALNVTTQPRFEFALADQDCRRGDRSRCFIVANRGGYFRYMEKYLAIELVVPAERFLGLGQRIADLSLRSGTYTLFTKDGQGTPETRENPGHNLSGMHPFLMFQLNTHASNFVGVFFRTSNALQAQLTPNSSLGSGTTTLRYTTVGGILDFYVFYRGTAQSVLRQYHQLIGKPPLPPMWTLGYQHGRAGFRRLEEVAKLVRRLQESDFPLDGLWVDSDIFENGKSFVINKTGFKGLREFVEYLHEHKVHFVPTIKAGINIDNNYYYFDKAEQKRALVRTGDDTRIVYGRDAYGNVSYPDFFSPDMCPIWDEGLTLLYNSSVFDGIRLTSNEYNNLCNGDCFHPQSNDPLDNLPFVPGSTPLNVSALSMSARYCSGDTGLDRFLVELNVHPLNSVLMANCTAGTISRLRPGLRGFVASRSTFPGTQKFAAGHQLPFGGSTWEHMRYSIPAMLTTQISGGLSMVGASICGYENDTDEELCVDWFRLGAFYPLSLNFNSNSSRPQEPYSFSPEALSAMRQAIRFKYCLLQYMYTSLFEMSLWGGTAVQPLFFEFPEDDLAFRSSSRVFLFGRSLLVTSPPAPGGQYSVYLPNAHWYTVPAGQKALTHRKTRENRGAFVQLDADSEYPNVFLRGGSIIPYQDAIGYKVKNVEELAEIPATIIVALDENEHANGRIVVDDGISSDTISSKKYRHYTLAFSRRILRISLTAGYVTNLTSSSFPELHSLEYLRQIQIWGARSLSNVTAGCMLTSLFYHMSLPARYDPATEILTLEYAGQPLPLAYVEAVEFPRPNEYSYCEGQHFASHTVLSKDFTQLASSLEYRRGDFSLLYRLKATVMSSSVLNLKIQPRNWTAWEVPDLNGVEINKDGNSAEGSTTLADYFFGFSQFPEEFYFMVARPEDLDRPILTTWGQLLQVTERFTRLPLRIRSTAVYGIGERATDRFLLSSGRYTIFPYDNNDTTSAERSQNMHGSHPFIMFRMPDGMFAGLFLMNSNAMDIDVDQFSPVESTITFVLSGGIIDLYVIQRGTPQFVISQYHMIIGRAFLPPFWAFGHHQSREGYRNAKQLRKVVMRYEEEELPIDSLWLGADYMIDMQPFTVDTDRFPDLRSFVHWLKYKDIMFVPVLLPTLHVNESCEEYKRALQRDVLIKTRGRKKPLIGAELCGRSVFIDYLHPNSSVFWVNALERFKNEFAPFDGFWLEGNEMTQLCNGACDGPRTADPKASYNLLYAPSHRNLEERTLPLVACHYAMRPEQVQVNVEYNMHSLNGHMQAMETSSYFQQENRRGFVMSRSTFAGSGQYAAHSFANSRSTWLELRSSLAQIFNAQLFGIAMTGADVCGYYGNAGEELCRRWYQLAAFYPLCRNHNEVKASDQEPYVTPALAETARAALRLRYSLIRYIYTLHFMVALNGGAYFTPTFFEFVEDENTFRNPEKSFMLGPALKVTPVLEEGANSVTDYFPNQDWFRLVDGKRDMYYSSKKKHGRNLTLSVPLSANNISVHIRGGWIIPFQKAMDPWKPRNTRQLTQIPIALMVALDREGHAQGRVAYDEGEGSYTIMHREYHLFNVSCSDGQLFVTLIANAKYMRSKALKDETFNEIILYGAAQHKETSVVCAYTVEGRTYRGTAKYNAETEKLVLSFKESISLLTLHAVIWQNIERCTVDHLPRREHS